MQKADLDRIGNWEWRLSHLYEIRTKLSQKDHLQTELSAIAGYGVPAAVARVPDPQSASDGNLDAISALAFRCHSFQHFNGDYRIAPEALEDFLQGREVYVTPPRRRRRTRSEIMEGVEEIF